MTDRLQSTSWLTPTEAAVYLKTTERHVRSLICTGKLPAKKRAIRGTGKRGHYFIRFADAEKYMSDLPDAGLQTARKTKTSSKSPVLAGVREFVS